MDQICIDQFDSSEQNKEVPKMRQYYGNASATLIAIDGKINNVNKNDQLSLIKQTLVNITQSS